MTWDESDWEETEDPSNRRKYGEPVPERTDVEVAALRKRMLKLHTPVAKTGFTCDGCSSVKRCPWAFDAYNTGGDCLAEK